MFGASPIGSNSAFAVGVGNATSTVNSVKNFEVTSPPDDTVSSLEFSPPSLQQNYLIAGSWDSSVR